MIIAYILFGLAGLAFGYAIDNPLAWIVLAIPLVFALGAAVSQGIEGEMVVKVVIALGLTAGCVLLGRAIAGRASPGETATS